jgi:hypothetical protein
MADHWTCSICYKTLRCGCQSMECSFDYDIRDHVRQDLRRALKANLDWHDLTIKELPVFVKRQIREIE